MSISLAFREGDLVNDYLFLRQGIKLAERRRGARVGRQAEIMPAEDSTMTDVQAFASVPVGP